MTHETRAKQFIVSWGFLRHAYYTQDESDRAAMIKDLAEQFAIVEAIGESGQNGSEAGK